MAGIHTTGTFPANLKEVAFGLTQMGYEMHPRLAGQIYYKAESRDQYEEIVSGYTFTQAQLKEEGDGVTYQTESQGVTTRATQATYALGFICTEEEAVYGKALANTERRGRRLGDAMRRKYDALAAAPLNNAFDSSYVYFNDGTSLISISHPSKVGSQANRANADADFNYTSLMDMDVIIRTAVDGSGNRIMLNPKTLLHNPTIAHDVAQIFGNSMQPDTAENNINTVRGLVSNRVNTPYIEDTDSWYILTDVPDGEGALWFEGMPLKTWESEDTETLNMKYAARFATTFIFGDWRAIYGSAGA